MRHHVCGLTTVDFLLFLLSPVSSSGQAGNQWGNNVENVAADVVTVYTALLLGVPVHRLVRLLMFNAACGHVFRYHKQSSASGERKRVGFCEVEEAL